MNVVDTSAWIEYFVDGSNAYYFAPAIEDLDRLIVPVTTLMEVFHLILSRRGEADALEAAAIMQQGRVVPLDGTVALSAAKIQVENGLPTSSSVTLATAIACGAALWTQDDRLSGVRGVRYVPKRPARRSRR